jgi:Icc-related predicted phosphoesterase
MEILVVGDCHGEKPEIEQAAEEADVILAVGDICGDSERMRESMFAAMNSGKEWYDVMGREDAKKAVQTSLAQGEKVLKYLNSFSKPVFVVPGNWDWDGRDEAWEFLAENRFQDLIEKFPNIHNINREKFTDSDYSYIGYGPCSGPEIPQYEDDRPEDEGEMQEIKEEYRREKQSLEELFRDAEKPAVFLSHNVPHGTSLDRIENPDSPADGRHYGSIIVEELIEEYQPVLSVAGHIHEGYGHEKIGDTLAMNAGLKSCVSIALDGGKIRNVEFHPSREDY